MAADTLHIATFNTELARKGPGILLRDITRGTDPQIIAVLDVIVSVSPDVIALQGVDYDLDLKTLSAFNRALGDQGLAYPYLFAAPPNAGLMTDLDLDGDGKIGGPGDAQGFGRFYGEGAMAVLSRHPILEDEVQDFSALAWRDIPDANLPRSKTDPFPSAAAIAVQRLSTNGHWVVPIQHPQLGRVDILTFHATPPVFDGAEDRNGKRNFDETRFWHLYLDGAFGATSDLFVIAGDANLDPDATNGRPDALRRLLARPDLQDPLPGHPTVEWPQTGPLRVDYVLPSAQFRVLDAGITAPNAQASRHQLVWVTLGPS